MIDSIATTVGKAAQLTGWNGLPHMYNWWKKGLRPLINWHQANHSNMHAIARQECACHIATHFDMPFVVCIMAATVAAPFS